ncbi:hypothetical protein QBC46DRAFT_422083 [Diplogelasinospora grovesii]|uniref:Uncharacterized protein n=1 Tax=Diplogelasinospora grovesii TaxID=303347 RepID=A0AAN6N157_9PEZI|nr:hypothetical protein QBC46DRAFT_422083 [Diplogelasinospora grovesii]
MKITTAISVLALAVLGHASPIPTERISSLTDCRSTIKWCQSANYRGTCQTTRGAVVGKCYEMNPDYIGTLASVQHDSGLTCYYYQSQYCETNTYTTAAGNTARLPANNNINSWMCDLTSQLPR